MTEGAKPVDHHDNPTFSRRYDELAPLFLDYEKARRVFKTLVSPAQRSLELGIGSGLFSLPLIAKGYQIDGIEPNNSMATSLIANAQALGINPPRVEQSTVIGHRFDSDHDVIYSHSGPMFITQDSGKLYYEGLRVRGGREKEIKENLRILLRILRHAERTNGNFLLNIQENKSGIKLSDGSTFNLNPVGKGYDTESFEATKRYEFVEPDGTVLENGGQGTYGRFACSLDQLKNLIARMGDFRISTHDNIWLSIKPR